MSLISPAPVTHFCTFIFTAFQSCMSVQRGREECHLLRQKSYIHVATCLESIVFANLNSSVLFQQLMLRSSKPEDGLNVPIPLFVFDLFYLNVPKLAPCGGGVRARDSNSTFQFLTKVCFNTLQGTCRSQVSPVLRWNEVVK